MVRHYVRKRTFTTAERVLIHLSSEALRPEDRTQEGIAAATRSGRSTLTKWLDRLERRGIVRRNRVRIESHPLPKFAYRLTESGWRMASLLRRRLSTEVVKVRAPRVGQLSVRVSEVPSIASARLDLTGTVAAVQKGRLDLAQTTRTSRGRSSLVWGNGLRRVDRFFGRAGELEDMDRWWARGSQILVVTGLAGVGKSSLVAAWVQSRRLRFHVYGFEIRPSSTPGGLLTDLGMFLAALGKPGLSAHLAQGVPLDFDFVSRLLERDPTAKPFLVIVDNADQASRELFRLVDRLFLRNTPRVVARVVLVGRRLPRWVEPANAGEPTLQILQLGGLDTGASRALLRSRGLGTGTAFAEEIIRKTKGHPLLLHLAATTGTGQAHAAQRYLEEEVWDALPSKDRAVLKAASIFRSAVRERVLEKVAGTDPRTIQSLAERNLLERTMAGGYVMHDLVRELVGSHLSETRRRRLGNRAASVLLQSTVSRDRWEGVYHLLTAGETSKAASLLDSEGAPLIDSVAAEEIASLVRGLTLRETESTTYCVFAEILGDSFRIRGHAGPALHQYGHARRLAESLGHPERVPRLLRKMASVERHRNRYPRALGYLVEARARLVSFNRSSELVEVLREMALVEQALGNVSEAAGQLSEAVDLATELSEHAALSRTLLALGSLEAQRGNPDQGLALDLEGLRTAERSGNLTEIAHAHIVVGAELIDRGKPEESLSHFAEGLAIATLLGNLRLMAYSTMNKVSALLHLGRYAEAGTGLRESMGYFRILEEEDGIGLLKTYEGEMEMGLGHWRRAQEAWREGVAILRAHGSRAELAHVLQDAAGFFARHGNRTESESYLIEARELARKTGNSALLSRIQRDLDALGVVAISKENP